MANLSTIVGLEEAINQLTLDALIYLSDVCLRLIEPAVIGGKLLGDEVQLLNELCSFRQP